MSEQTNGVFTALVRLHDNWVGGVVGGGVIFLQQLAKQIILFCGVNKSRKVGCQNHVF